MHAPHITVQLMARRLADGAGDKKGGKRTPRSSLLGADLQAMRERSMSVQVRQHWLLSLLGPDTPRPRLLWWLRLKLRAQLALPRLLPLSLLQVAVLAGLGFDSPRSSFSSTGSPFARHRGHSMIEAPIGRDASILAAGAALQPSAASFSAAAMAAAGGGTFVALASPTAAASSVYALPLELPEADEMPQGSSGSMQQPDSGGGWAAAVAADLRGAAELQPPGAAEIQAGAWPGASPASPQPGTHVLNAPLAPWGFAAAQSKGAACPQQQEQQEQQ
jgi:hypothetical protein